MNAATCLTRLEMIRTVFDQDIAVQKLELLDTLKKKRLTTARQVQRLHDLLCFICAYPDNEQVYALANTLLHKFASRSDLKQHRKVLVNSGIAGTSIDYQFYWPMACWLAKNWPEQLQLLWQHIDVPRQQKLLKLMPLLVPFNEATAFDEYDFPPKQWLHRLKGKNETDAVFFTRRLAACFGNDFEREAIHDDLDLSYRLVAATTSPSLATTRYQHSSVVCQRRSLDQTRPDLKTWLRQCPVNVQPLSIPQGKILVDLARKTMVTHERDLDAFSYGNPADVSLIDFGDGYQIACIGVIAERRYLIHATYGFLNLKNGIPIGYMALSTAFRTADVAFNLFSAFRGAEAALVYARNLAIAHRHFGANTFIVDPYQLGYNNQDGLKSGVWWFYYKLGFRPTDKDVRKLLQQELAKIKKTAGYRTPLTVLNQLASANMYFNLDNHQADYETLAALSPIVPGLSAYLASRFGAEREHGLRVCAEEVSARLGLTYKSMRQDEILALQRWSPLLLNLGQIEKWSRADRDNLIKLLRGKGQPRETEYLFPLNQHDRLQREILAFADASKECGSA